MLILINNDILYIMQQKTVVLVAFKIIFWGALLLITHY